MSMLRIDQATVGYRSGVPVLHDLTMEIEPGEVVSLIGSNGAGKTTTLRTIIGLLHCWQGIISFDGEDVTRLSTKDLVHRGMAIVPEGRRLFPSLTVAENLLVGSYTKWDRTAKDRMDEVLGLFPALERLIKRPADALSGGEQQMVAVGRALMSRPRMLLLDEPSMGLAPVVIEELFRKLRELSKTGVTLLIVEQNAVTALEMADRGYVMEQGRITLSGPGRSLLNNDSVQRAYLGI